MNAIMSIRGLSHIYSPKTPFECSAIDNICLDIFPGETLGIIGHTGSGKSTLISHLNGLIKPSSGTILYDGEDIFKSKEFTHSIRFKVGLVLQYPEYQLFEETVYKDIAFGPSNMKLTKDEIHTRVLEAAHFAGIDESLLDASPFDLSGGQKRRVAIAGIIAMRPKCVVLDEPTAMLDPKGRREVMETIRQLNKELGITVVIITHYMDEAAMCDRVVVVDDGKIIMDSNPREVFGSVEKIKERGLDVPQVTELCHELKKAGFDISECVLTEEECVEALEKLLKGGAQNG